MQYRNPSQNNPSQPLSTEAAPAPLEQPPTDPAAAPPTAGSGSAADEPTVELPIDGADLLRVIREPIEWTLGLAQRLAGDDPVDLAAVARLHAAFLARLAGQPARIRKTDVLIVFGLLVGALDPSAIVRAVSDRIGDGFAAVLGAEASLGIQLTGAVNPFADLLAVLRLQCSGERRKRRPLRSHLDR